MARALVVASWPVLWPLPLALLAGWALGDWALPSLVLAMLAPLVLGSLPMLVWTVRDYGAFRRELAADPRPQWQQQRWYWLAWMFQGRRPPRWFLLCAFAWLALILFVVAPLAVSLSRP